MREYVPTEKIEITKAMIEAGVAEIERYQDISSARFLATQVYRSMAEAYIRVKRPPSDPI